MSWLPSKQFKGRSQAISHTRFSLKGEQDCAAEIIWYGFWEWARCSPVSEWCKAPAFNYPRFERGEPPCRSRPLGRGQWKIEKGDACCDWSCPCKNSAKRRYEEIGHGSKDLGGGVLRCRELDVNGCMGASCLH